MHSMLDQQRTVVTECDTCTKRVFECHFAGVESHNSLKLGLPSEEFMLFFVKETPVALGASQDAIKGVRGNFTFSKR